MYINRHAGETSFYIVGVFIIFFVYLLFGMIYSTIFRTY